MNCSTFHRKVFGIFVRLTVPGRPLNHEPWPFRLQRAQLAQGTGHVADRSSPRTLASAAACLHMAGMTEEICPLCGRTLGDVNVDRHHLVPKTFKGKEQFFVHKICHRKIHSVFTERELLRKYHTWEALREDPDIQLFIEWVGRKPPAFYAMTATSKKKRGR